MITRKIYSNTVHATLLGFMGLQPWNQLSRHSNSYFSFYLCNTVACVCVGFYTNIFSPAFSLLLFAVSNKSPNCSLYCANPCTRRQSVPLPGVCSVWAVHHNYQWGTSRTRTTLNPFVPQSQQCRAPMRSQELLWKSESLHLINSRCPPSAAGEARIIPPWVFVIQMYSTPVRHLFCNLGLHDFAMCHLPAAPRGSRFWLPGAATGRGTALSGEPYRRPYVIAGCRGGGREAVNPLRR